MAFVAVSGAAAAESTLGTEGGCSARLATISEMTSTVLPGGKGGVLAEERALVLPASSAYLGSAALHELLLAMSHATLCNALRCMPQSVACHVTCRNLHLACYVSRVSVAWLCAMASVGCTEPHFVR